ncbi:hypothetical protein GCM10010149_79030 [Nonomuraea roseoviolacea subsp. roseoviolacea]
MLLAEDHGMTSQYARREDALIRVVGASEAEVSTVLARSEPGGSGIAGTRLKNSESRSALTERLAELLPTGGQTVMLQESRNPVSPR